MIFGRRFWKLSRAAFELEGSLGMQADQDFEEQRKRMVDEQLLERDIRDLRVLEAMRTVPRHLFIAPEYAVHAYADSPLPIGHEQTISQPYIVALMTQLLNLQGSEKVLEIGTGSGYQAAILAHLASEVYTVERIISLARRAETTLRQMGLSNVTFHVGDGTRGWAEHAPYDRIMVTAAAPQVPRALFEQLVDGGLLVIPVGGRGNQTLQRLQRKGPDYESEIIVPVAFVPLKGDFGWEG
jgi:protein-L-isoaspartate(D-aspartate) O-methyltransferase